ncbi:MAG TPA: sugar phosphate isomerase/epimerase family protein [Verrucomicrobiae bacterium]|nr:sugar phosphate isomerase/epimerase family protein [Verrucomicrobiae bacterium]
MKFAICNEIFQGWKIEEVFAHAAQLGYEGLEIAPFTLANSVTEITSGQRKSIREASARNGIAVVGIHWILVKPEGLYLNHSDPGVRRRTSEYLRALVDFCADIGGDCMVAGSPRQRNVLPGVSREQARDWALETFRSAADAAAQRQVTICFEPLAPAETNFINTAAEAIEFVQALASPSVQIILDVKAMCSESKPIPRIIRESWPHFAHFHANDKNLKGPGFGKVDFRPIASALREVGYSRYVSVEVFDFSDGAEVIARKSIDYLKETFAQAAGPVP